MPLVVKTLPDGLHACSPTDAEKTVLIVLIVVVVDAEKTVLIVLIVVVVVDAEKTVLIVLIVVVVVVDAEKTASVGGV